VNNRELGAYLARRIFEIGDEPEAFGGKVQRIAFKGGTWPDHEKDNGGLNETALAGIITQALDARTAAPAVDG
jgi:hypothetical protein